MHADGGARGARSSPCRRRWLEPNRVHPPLPGQRDQLTQRMPLGTVTKCMAVYDEPFWRAEGLSGQGFERSRPGQGHLRQLAARRDARRAPRLPRGPPRASSAGAGRERQTAVIDCFARLFGPRGGAGRLRRARLGRGGVDPRLLRLLHATGAWTGYGHALRAPVGPLHWAGAETARVWNGYMDGAVALGRAAGPTATRWLPPSGTTDVDIKGPTRWASSRQRSLLATTVEQWSDGARKRSRVAHRLSRRRAEIQATPGPGRYSRGPPVKDTDASAYDGLVLPGGVANPTSCGPTRTRPFVRRSSRRASPSPRSATTLRRCGLAHITRQPPDRHRERGRQLGRRGGRVDSGLARAAAPTTSHAFCEKLARSLRGKPRGAGPQAPLSGDYW